MKNDDDEDEEVESDGPTIDVEEGEIDWHLMDHSMINWAGPVELFFLTFPIYEMHIDPEGSIPIPNVWAAQSFWSQMIVWSNDVVASFGIQSIIAE
jgi:hypothetical protein